MRTGLGSPEPRTVKPQVTRGDDARLLSRSRPSSLVMVPTRMTSLPESPPSLSDPKSRRLRHSWLLALCVVNAAVVLSAVALSWSPWVQSGRWKVESIERGPAILIDTASGRTWRYSTGDAPTWERVERGDEKRARDLAIAEATLVELAPTIEKLVAKEPQQYETGDRFLKLADVALHSVWVDDYNLLRRRWDSAMATVRAQTSEQEYQVEFRLNCQLHRPRAESSPLPAVGGAR